RCEHLLPDGDASRGVLLPDGRRGAGRERDTRLRTRVLDQTALARTAHSDLRALREGDAARTPGDGPGDDGRRRGTRRGVRHARERRARRTDRPRTYHRARAVRLADRV